MIKEGLKIFVNPMDLAPDFVNCICQDHDVTALFIFGSAAMGALKTLSDLDLAVLLSKRLTRDERIKKQLDLLGMSNELFKTDEIDLVVLNDAPPRIAHNILKTGRLLFIADRAEFSDFFEQVMRKYLDFKYFRESFDQAFLKGIGYHG